MKTYVKPELYFEHYELSQHIAACALKLNYNSVNDCFATANTDLAPGNEGIKFFTDATICDPNANDPFCYFNGGGSHATFMS